MPEMSSQGWFLSVPSAQNVGGEVSVRLKRAGSEPTPDLPLWVVIRNTTEALSFNHYQRFVDHVLCNEPLHAEGSTEPTPAASYLHPEAFRAHFAQLRQHAGLPFAGADGYRLLRAATEAFVLAHCGVALHSYQFDAGDESYLEARTGLDIDLDRFWHRYLVAVNGTANATLPYLALVRAKFRELSIKHRLFADVASGEIEQCTGILGEKLFAPCLLELIWCYFIEQAGAVQAANLILRRFQNLTSGPNDPLSHVELNPLRPLTHILWGVVHAEPQRLTVKRRAYEYRHEYGLTLEGRAVRNLHPADERPKFLEAFHNLLYLCTRFFEVDDNTTQVADGFPLLAALREVHLEVAHGAHNQFSDMPAMARVEILMLLWLLARPELAEFLPSRAMVANPEPWMDRVDVMRKLQRWGSTPSLHFRNLAQFGERLLLAIRFGSWADVNDPNSAANLARFFRPEILGYIHAYRAVTGVDLGTRVAGKVDATQPSILLRRQLPPGRR